MPRPAALGRGAAFASGRSLATNSRAWDDVLDHMAPVDRGDGDRGVVLVGVAQSPVLPRQWRRDGFSISTDPKYFDLAVIHGYLVRSSWAEGIPVEIVQRSLEHSLGFALFEGEPGGRQVGFARVTTDFATFGYLADVFVLETYRGRGLGRWICEIIMAHPDLQGFHRWLLATSTARGLHEKLGWYLVKRPEIFMEISVPDIYTSETTPTELQG